MLNYNASYNYDGYTDGIIDIEALGRCPDGMLIEFSFIPFKFDVINVPSFDELIKSGIKIKFSLESQKGLRATSPNTLEWWKKQPPEAKEILRPCDTDLHYYDACKSILDSLPEAGISKNKSHLWCRGMSYDFPYLSSLIAQVFNTDPQFLEPVIFNRQRDIRTAIEAYLTTRDLTYCPLKIGVLPDTFVKHDSLNDCARDILMLIYAKRYSLGLEEPPSEDEIDPNSRIKF